LAFRGFKVYHVKELDEFGQNSYIKSSLLLMY